MSSKTEKQAGNEVLVSYTGMNMAYQQGKLMFIAGEEDAQVGDVGTLALPAQAPQVAIDPQIPDPVVFSYTFDNGQDPIPRVLLAKIVSQGGVIPSSCTFTVLVPSATGAWVTKALDFTMNSGGVPMIFNPHGLAEWGDFVYLIDYESQQIVIAAKKELETATGGVLNLSVTPFDLSGDLIDPNARGQAVIALNGFLYALYLSTDIRATAYGNSHLVRMTIGGGGSLAFDIETLVGRNAQAIIPVINASTTYLLVPAIGGPQDYSGHTNGTESNVYAAVANGDWENDPATVRIVVTGDPAATPATAYDIHAVAAAMRDGTSALYILTQIYNNSSRSAPWRIYRATVSDFLTITGPNNSLSAAVTAGKLTVVDESTAQALDSAAAYGVYFWDLLYEQVPGNDDDGDRLWAALGTPILATRAGDNYIGDPAYGSPTALFQNAYVMFGSLGGVNVNSLDLTAETLHQAARGVSLKRTLRSTQTPRPTEEEIAAINARIQGAKNK
jgi:hypothetical protein